MRSLSALLSRRSFIKLAASALAAVGLRVLLDWGATAGGRLRLVSAGKVAGQGKVWLIAEEPNTSWLMLAASLGWRTEPPLSTDQGVPIHVIHAEPGQRPRHVVVSAKSLARSRKALALVLFERDLASVDTWPASITSGADLLVAIGSPRFNPFDDAHAIPDKFWIPVTTKKPGATHAVHHFIEQSTRETVAAADWMGLRGL